MNICNSCGSPHEVRICQHCPTLICARCRTNHESVCEVNRKKKSLGLGPTVRQVNIVPEKPVVEPAPAQEAQEAVNTYLEVLTETLQNPSIVEKLADSMTIDYKALFSDLTTAIGFKSEKEIIVPVASVEIPVVSEAPVEEPIAVVENEVASEPSVENPVDISGDDGLPF